MKSSESDVNKLLVYYDLSSKNMQYVAFIIGECAQTYHPVACAHVDIPIHLNTWVNFQNRYRSVSLPKNVINKPPKKGVDSKATRRQRCTTNVQHADHYVNESQVVHYNIVRCLCEMVCTTGEPVPARDSRDEGHGWQKDVAADFQRIAVIINCR